MNRVEPNRPWPWALPLAFVLALALPAAADVAETLDRIYQEHGLQSELPSVADEPEAYRLGLPQFGGAPYALLVVLAAVLVVLLVAWLANADREGWQQRLEFLRRPNRSATAPSPAPNPQLANADELALQGRYSEAIHALLLAALAGLSERAGWPSAATGREIAVRHVPSEDLRLLVAAAELAHFGGRQATPEEYRVCRSQALRLSVEGPLAAAASAAASRDRLPVRRGR